jgi:ribosomal protein L7/L12
MAEVVLGIGAVVAAVFLLDVVNRAKMRSLRQRGILPPEGGGSDADIERLLRLGYKVQAIKLYRSVHDVDLKAAKTEVERLHRRMREQGDVQGPA